MSAKPLVMTREQVEKWYHLSTEESVNLCDRLEAVGFYERTDNPLFSRRDIEKELKKCRTA